MATNDKDTIYIDIDDEITGIIDKVNSSDGKITALVLPKRATALQSIVNMKLLKRAADGSKKHLVLITTEASLLPLAGMAGVHVAKTLSSKPEIPLAPNAPDDSEEMVNETDDEEITATTAGDRPVGELAGAGAAAAIASDEMETLELDDDELPEDLPGPTSPKKKDFNPKGKKDKKLKVPDFNKFRLLLIIGGAALILLIVGFIFANSVLPKATITVKTDASTVDTTDEVNLSTAAKTLDLSTNTVPAKLVSQPKTYTGQVNTTGQQNNGEKATGSVTLTLCASNPAQVQELPAGTGVSSGGKTYITTEATSYSFAGGSCGSGFKFTSKVGITAQTGGTNFNLSNGNFTVSGSSATGQGSASGGTDNIVQTVSQADINNAKAKITLDDSTMKQTLQNQLKQDNYYPIAATYSTGTPTATNSANVGDPASSVTVTEVVTYTMFGAQEDDLNKIVDASVKKKIETGKQSILSRGLDKAVFNVNNASATGAALSMSTEATVGPDLDVAGIRKEAAGKKPGAVKTDLQGNPDVTDVEVKLSPFWVSSVPKKEGKITVNIAKPESSKSNNNAN
jgi:hypothetical protein